MTNPSVPQAKVALRKLYFPEQSVRLVEISEELPDKGSLQFGWDWRLVEGRTFEVTIAITLAETKARPEVVRVAVAGIFESLEDLPDTALTDFVRVNGPSILFPFAREAISSLTSRSFFPAIHLPLVNMAKLVHDMDPETTVGARQLRDKGPKKAE